MMFLDGFQSRANGIGGQQLAGLQAHKEGGHIPSLGMAVEESLPGVIEGPVDQPVLP